MALEARRQRAHLPGEVKPGQILSGIVKGVLAALAIASLLNAQMVWARSMTATIAACALPAFLIRAVRAEDAQRALPDTAAACACAGLVVLLILDRLSG